MIGKNLRYYRGGRDRFEAVELEVLRKDGSHITTCVINVKLFLCGLWNHPCGNGDYFTIPRELRLKVLEFVQNERKKITDSYPVKTYKGWLESGLPTFEDYCFPGDEVDKKMVEHFVSSIPPVLLRSACTQAGEAHSSEVDERAGRYRDTYTTFHVIEGERWRFDGYCFYGENENRYTHPSRLEQLIDEARKETRT